MEMEDSGTRAPTRSPNGKASGGIAGEQIKEWGTLAIAAGALALSIHNTCQISSDQMRAIARDEAEVVEILNRAWNLLGIAEAQSSLRDFSPDPVRLAKADQLIQEAEARAPHYPKTHLLRGVHYYGLGRFAQALHEFEEASRLSPGWSAPYNSAGITLDRLKRYREAAAKFRQAIVLDPGSAAAYSNLGGLLSEHLGDLQEAMRMHRKAIELDPMFADAYSDLATTLVRLGQHREAVVAACRAAALRGSSPPPGLVCPPLDVLIPRRPYLER